MKKLLLVAALAISVVGLAYADLEFTPAKVPANLQESPGGGAAGQCLVQYYNACSGWIYVWTGWLAGDMVGTIYDLPADCDPAAFEPGGCTLYEARFVIWTVLPGWGYTVDFEVYDVDAQDCLVTPALAGMYDVDFPSGPSWWILGNFGPVPDKHAFTMAWDTGIYPTIATDNPPSNYQAPYYCAGYVVDGHSYVFAASGTPYCPPVFMNDGTYDVNLYARNTYDCVVVATEEESWGGVKNLFR